MNITKSKILQAFCELSNICPVDSITVTDISEKTGLSRQSFYYHFSNIDKMIEFYIESIMNSMQEKIKGINKIDEIIEAYFVFTKENEKYIMPVLNSSKRVYAEAVILRWVQKFVLNCFENELEFSLLKPDDKRIALEFNSMAIAGFIIQNIQYGNVKYETDVKKLCNCFNPFMKALGSCEE